MGWRELLTLLGMLCGLLMTADTFRSKATWFQSPSARPGPSPRQRRWLGIGLSLLMAGQLIHLRLEGDSWLWSVSFSLIGIGIACVLAGIFRGPTPDERRRRARLLGPE